MSAPSISFIVQPCSMKKLAELYGVHRNTFTRWLTPFQQEIGPRCGYYYTIAQVRTIISRLGMPGSIILD
jgi:transposase-like protein